MSARTRLSVAALAVLAAVTTLPGAGRAEYNGNTAPTPVPTQPPPVCGVGKGLQSLPFTCDTGKRADLYAKADCPPDDSAPNGWVFCQNPPNAPSVGMSCWDFGGDFECTAAPYSSTNGLTYTWSATGPLTVYQPDGNRSPLVYLGCLRLSGGGWLTLTVTTAQNVSTTVTEYLSCLP